MIQRTEVQSLLQRAKAKQSKQTDQGTAFQELLQSKQENGKSLTEGIKAQQKSPEQPQGAKSTTQGAESSASKKGEPAAQAKDQETSQEIQTEQPQAVQVLAQSIGQVPPQLNVDEQTGILQAESQIVEMDAELLAQKLEHAQLSRPMIQRMPEQSEALEAPIFAEKLEQMIQKETGNTIQVHVTHQAQSVAKESEIFEESDVTQQKRVQEYIEIQPQAIAQAATRDAELREAEEIPRILIKVSDETQLTQKLGEALTEQIQIQVQDSAHYEIQLNPAQLGKILVKVTVENNVTHLTMEYSNKKTMELMQKQTGELARMLENSRDTQVVVSVKQAQPDYLEQDQNQSSSQQSREQRHREQLRDSEQFLEELKARIVHAQEAV